MSTTQELNMVLFCKKCNSFQGVGILHKHYKDKNCNLYCRKCWSTLKRGRIKEINDFINNNLNK